MPENGEIPSTGDPRVDAALQRIRGKFKDLEDAMLVQLQLEKRAEQERQRRYEDHDRWLQDHQRVLSIHNAMLQKHAEMQTVHEQRMAQFDLQMLEIEDKLNLLIDREMRREGGPESPA